MMVSVLASQMLPRELSNVTSRAMHAAVLSEPQPPEFVLKRARDPFSQAARAVSVSTVCLESKLASRHQCRAHLPAWPEDLAELAAAHPAVSQEGCQGICSRELAYAAHQAELDSHRADVSCCVSRRTRHCTCEELSSSAGAGGGRWAICWQLCLRHAQGMHCCFGAGCSSEASCGASFYDRHVHRGALLGLNLLLSLWQASCMLN